MGDLGPGEHGADVVDEDGQRAHPVQEAPAADPVEQHAMEARMEQHHNELRREAGLLSCQRLEIGANVLEHAVYPPRRPAHPATLCSGRLVAPSMTWARNASNISRVHSGVL